MKVIASENPLRFNPHYKLKVDSSGRYQMVYHSHGRDSNEMEMAIKLSKRGYMKKKINKD